MFGSGDLLGRRTSGNPLGRGRPFVSTAPLRGIGLAFPDREMDATERFDYDESEVEDDLQPLDYEWTARDERPY